MRDTARWLGALVAVAVLASSVAACGGGDNGTSGKKGDYTIALSNSFLGNTWRQTMVKVFEHTAKQAQSQGLIKSYKVLNTGQNTASEQIAQLKSLILQQVDAILVNAAAPNSLNPTIEQACSKGIVVVVFDSLTTDRCSHKLQDSIADYGFQEGKFVGQAMGGKGNLLMVRGVVGSQPEKIIYDGQLKALEAYPKVKTVKQVVGQASNPITEKVVGNVPAEPAVGSGRDHWRQLARRGQGLPCRAQATAGARVRQLRRVPALLEAAAPEEPGLQRRVGAHRTRTGRGGRLGGSRAARGQEVREDDDPPEHRGHPEGPRRVDEGHSAGQRDDLALVAGPVRVGRQAD